ncbi:MAG: HNH endonuclease [Schwartzia sp.]|nr:HNH endonuclease [Schwartzia sp. (in: firmicutes)]
MIWHSTPEQDAYIAEINQGRTAAEVTAMVNNKFGIDITVSQLKGYRHRHNLISGLTGYFPKGGKPWNKGLHFQAGGRSKETQFKKGHRPHNWREVGSEIIDAEGYTWLKLAEGDRRMKHVVMWEEYHHRKLPKGMKVIFADRNKQNFARDNLLAVTCAELAVMNHLNLIYEDAAEATRAGLEIARLKLAQGRAKRKKRGWSFTSDKKHEEADKQHELEKRDAKNENDKKRGNEKA